MSLKNEVDTHKLLGHLKPVIVIGPKFDVSITSIVSVKELLVKTMI